MHHKNTEEFAAWKSSELWHKLWHKSDIPLSFSVCFYALTWLAGCHPLLAYSDLQTCYKSGPIWCPAVPLGPGRATRWAAECIDAGLLHLVVIVM